jgi:hypothetical protein
MAYGAHMTVSLRTDEEARAALPPPGPLIRRVHRHPRLMHHNRLIAAVLAVNIAIAWYGATTGSWWSTPTVELATIAAVAQANFVLAVLPRQPQVVNLAGWLATRPRSTRSLRLRWAVGKYYHLGGVHVGAALAGTAWYLAYVVTSISELARGVPTVSAVTVGLALAVVVVFVVIVLAALPRARARNHDRFEATHRLGAWAALGLVWIGTVVSTRLRHPGTPLLEALMETPTVWLLGLTTALATWPWLLLRRVPITVHRPSLHAAIVQVDHDTPYRVGTTRAISRHPIVGWHQFGVVPPVTGAHGYRMVVSRAGDWTGEFIDDTPTHVWVRGVPAVGVANVRRLFSKVVFVVTGSGIGPGLGHLLAAEGPTKLVWITRAPRRTYGDALVDEVLAAQPDALIWNTDERGKPDVLALTHETYVSSGAEAVICIANRGVTWQVVHGLESRGIPAFGPIWDS